MKKRTKKAKVRILPIVGHMHGFGGPVIFTPPPVKDTNPKDAAASTRLDLSLVPDSAIAFCALGLTEGHRKYRGYNWRVAGVLVSVYVAALRRHMARFANGEWADPMTGVPHLASIQACSAILIDSFVQGNVNDDRPPSQDMGALFAEFEGITKKIHGLYPAAGERHTQKQVALRDDVKKFLSGGSK